MTSTLRANRRTTVNPRLMLLSAVTSLLCLPGTGIAQDPPQQPKESSFTPPTREQLYRTDSESSLAELFRQQRKLNSQSEAEFPDEDSIRIKTSLTKRSFKAMQAEVRASYVVYQPLYFQQINVERYGWELGIFQPVVSTAQFYGDVLLFPYKFAANPPWHCDANVGYALPGDPEPLRFLTTPFSWRGVAAQAGVAVGGAGIFP